MVLWPGVDAEVRFGEQQHASHACPRAEMVEMGGENSRSRRLCRLAQEVFKTFGVAKQGGVAAVAVEQGVAAGEVARGIYHGLRQYAGKGIIASSSETEAFLCTGHTDIKNASGLF